MPSFVLQLFCLPLIGAWPQRLKWLLFALQALQPGAATALDAATLEAIAGDVPSASLEAGQVVGQPLIQVMVAAGLQPSKAASKRMIKVFSPPTSPSHFAEWTGCICV